MTRPTRNVLLLLDVEVPGPPVGKGRPIASTRGGHVRMRTPERTATWEAMAAWYARAAWRREPLARDVPVGVRISAVIERPRRLLGTTRRPAELGRLPCTAKPDLDNIAKACLDALVLAGVLVDDKAVAWLEASKEYAAVGELAHVRICVRDGR